MKNAQSYTRKSHFLGTKIRNLRKRNNLTLEDLSSRCVKANPESAPSVSYLSMIERGQRVPGEDTLEVIADVFQKDLNWFLDDVPEEASITPIKSSAGGISGMALEPGFLFTNDILQIAIPEMLSQTGTTGREFAHLLIRAYQEHHRNHFPDLERAAEEVGKKRLPLNLDDIYKIAQHLGLKIKWFNQQPEKFQDETGKVSKRTISSFLEPPNTIYVNEKLKSQFRRLKYDLSVQIGHCVLHGNDGLKSVMVAGKTFGSNLDDNGEIATQSPELNAQDILHAWRDFECSFFAGALLCPRVPFRQLLDAHAYEIKTSKIVEVSDAVAMRRMTAVSPYPHWHFFDAYSPGTLKAVYRGNGIPLPWGNMRSVNNPCPHWAVFRMDETPLNQSSAQISILDVGDETHIYSCESLKVKDFAENKHVLCAGIDLNPAIEAQGKDPRDLAAVIKAACVKKGGRSPLPKNIKADLASVAKILNIGWVQRGIEKDAHLICSRGSTCPRTPGCYKKSRKENPHDSIQKFIQGVIANN